MLFFLTSIFSDIPYPYAPDVHLSLIHIYPNACEEMCAPLFTPTWKDKTVMAAAGKEWMDCTAPGSGKGPSVAFLQEYLGISPDETCTFGDNLNDIEMLQNAGLSYACLLYTSDNPKLHEERKLHRSLPY